MTGAPSSSDRERLIAALQDRDAFRRRSALETLGRTPADGVLDGLVLGALNDGSGYVVRAAAEIASRWRLGDAAPQLRLLCADADPLTRRAALGALREVGSEADIDMLLGVFSRDRERDVRNAAAWAMAALAGPASWRRALPVLLGDTTPRHRIFACELIAKFGDAADMETLRPLLDDADGHVRKAAARALDGQPS